MDAPESIITNQQYNFGRYTTPFKNVNLLDTKKSAFLKKTSSFFLREWQAFQIFTEGYFGIMAIYNTKKISLVQFILYDIKNDKKIKFEKKVFPWQLNIPNGLYKTEAKYTSSNCTMIVKHDLDNNILDIHVDVKKGEKHPAIKAQLKGEHNINQYTPIVVCLPFSPKRGMYSHKNLMPLSGEIYLDDQKIILDPTQSNLIIDDHKGYYPYITKYDWVTGAGFSSKGDRIGFNFTDNQIQNKEKYNENGVWINGELTYLPAIKVDRPNGYQNDWIIKDKNNIVDLVFSPVAHNAVNVNAIILRSKYQGPYGYYNGNIKTKKGNIDINNIFGMGEDFYLRS